MFFGCQVETTFSGPSSNLDKIFSYIESSDEEIEATEPSTQATQSKSTQSKSTQSKSTQPKSTQSKSTQPKSRRKKKKAYVTDDEDLTDEFDIDYEEILLDLGKNRTKSKRMIKAKEDDKELTEVNESFKRLLSTATETESKRMKPNFEEEEFMFNIPKWGGQVKDENGDSVHFSNTCSIDYFLFAIWATFRLKPDLEYADRDHDVLINEMIKKIDEKQWGRAKSIWIRDILKMKPQKKGKQMTISTLGTTNDMFINIFRKQQEIKITSTCSLACKNNNKTLTKSELCFYHTLNNVTIIQELFCKKCKQNTTSNARFTNTRPLFLFIESNIHLTHDILPQTINIENHSYRLLCEIYYQQHNSHFVSLFSIFNSLYYFDDLNNIEKVSTYNTRKPINSCFYYLD